MLHLVLSAKNELDGNILQHQTLHYLEAWSHHFLTAMKQLKQLDKTKTHTAFSVNQTKAIILTTAQDQ